MKHDGVALKHSNYVSQGAEALLALILLLFAWKTTNTVCLIETGSDGWSLKSSSCNTLRISCTNRSMKLGKVAN